MAFSRKDRSLLVSRKNVADTAALKHVVQGHDRAAGVAKDKLDSLSAQALQKYFCASKHSRPVFSGARTSLPNLFAATTSSREGSRPRLRPGAAFPLRAGQQIFFRPFCFLRSTRARTCRFEYQQGSSSSRC